MPSPSNQSVILQLMQTAYTHHQKGEFAQAENYYQQVLSIDPKHPDANQFLGIIAHQFGHHEAAIKLLEKAISTDSKNAQRHYVLGGIFDKAKKQEKAIKSYQKAIKFKPDFAEALNNLGLIYKNLNRYQEAINCFNNALKKHTQSAMIWANLGNVYKESGQMDLAIDCLEKAVTIDPELSAVYSNLLLALNYIPGISPDMMFQKHLQWEKNYLSTYPLNKHTQKNHDFSNRTFSQSKLKIAYLSPDLHTHSVAYFVEPLLKEHDKTRFEIFAYYNNSKSDETSKRLAGYVDHWLNVFELTDEQLADKIFEDQIDILIDLAGHSANNRMGVFAQKPAPVQVTWLGYPNTTGLSAIDYRFTDDIADPPGESDQRHSETLIRLQDGFLCYQGDDTFPIPEQIPYDKNGYVTFGSFNNYVKVTPEVVSVWADALKAVPDSKLIIKSNQLSDKITSQNCKVLFKHNGIASNRIILVGFLPNPNDHMTYYGQVDIALDPFPYNGTTTTFEALWMGVPTITFCGNSHASRVGASILSRVELQSFISHTREEYIALAKSKAENLDDIRSLRINLRTKMIDSPLCDQKHFALQMEDSFQGIWKSFIEGERA